MCDSIDVLTLDNLFDETIHSKDFNKQKDCLMCTNSCQKNRAVDLIEVVKVKSKCCKRYEKKKKSHCKGCPERNRAVV